MQNETRFNHATMASPSAGFTSRVMARIEVASDEIEQLLAMREPITDRFKLLGFNFIAADLNGYRQGSLNEVLK